MKAVNLTGQTFGRLTVVCRAPNIRRRTAWLCRCICGVNKMVKGMHLRSGRTLSCGCYQRDILSARNQERRALQAGAERREYKRKYNLAQLAALREYRRKYAQENAGAIREYRRKFNQKHPERAKRHRANNYVPCPACSKRMYISSSACRDCTNFLLWRDGMPNGNLTQSDIKKAIPTITREDKEKWKAVKTQKEAMLLRKQLLKTLQSQTSGKNRDLSASLPKDSPQRTQRK